ncbi:MAG: NAD-dependent epimerase/dehydratase family protein [Promethearchaeota archaeon]
MNLSNLEILVTGGTGFIGSAIVNRLIEYKCRPHIITIPGDSYWRINDINKCILHEVDLRQKKEVETLIKQISPKIIIHLAALVNPERELKIINKIYSINLLGTQNLILSLQDIDYFLFINTGTSDEYGNTHPPFGEDCRESPVSPYAASKVAVTYFCEMMSKIYNKPIITVRPFLPYGPKQISSALIPSLIKSAISNTELKLTLCEQTRDFIYIEDLVDAYIQLIMNAERVKNMGIFNVGSGIETKIIDVVNFISKQFKNTKFLVGAKQYRPGEQMHHYASIEKIKNMIKWAPKWTLNQGLKITIDWWKKNFEYITNLLK